MTNLQPMSKPFELSQKLFQEFATIAYDSAGIRLGAGKEALVEARIATRIRALGLDTPKQYLEQLRHDRDGEELSHFVDVISTNFTSFFRESEHFDILSDLVKSRMREGVPRLRLWSAAASSGEEPYSMAMTVAEAVGSGTLDWRILATDISQRVLAFAKNGTYPRSRLRGVPKYLVGRYFDRLSPRSVEDPIYQTKPEFRAHVALHRLNLAAPPFPMKGLFDAVFCRNVMIYFDHYVRQTLIAAIEQVMQPGGILMIGHAETLSGLKTRFTLLRPSVYVFHEVGLSDSEREIRVRHVKR